VQYDLLYPTFAGPLQAGLRLGRWCGIDPSLLSPLFERFDHRHGWRRKQAHDATHDWIKYRRGLCNLCELTFTFLPAFSLPYTHYSLVARSEALRRRFVEHCSWESAAPTLKDPNRIPDPSTLRRWCHSLDASPAFSFLRRTVQAIEQWLARGEQLAHDSLPLAWPTAFCFLRVFWPWPLRL